MLACIFRRLRNTSVVPPIIIPFEGSDSALAEASVDPCEVADLNIIYT